MDGGFRNKKHGASFSKRSLLLELAASDDLLSFKTEIEENGYGIDEAGLWYGRRIGSKQMGFEERTPLMIASMFGSVNVLKYILGTGQTAVNRACGSDKATALHCAVAGGSSSSLEVVRLLLNACADVDRVDVNGNKPIDVIPPPIRSNSCSPRKRELDSFLRGSNSLDEFDAEGKVTSKKEYPVDIALPDINDAMFSSDEFRMYTFKVKPCSRAYSHDWTECPFVHPGENARRRDPRKYPYTCVPCPEFKKGGSCQKGDLCDFAHGVFESWLHPAQYRTRLCKDEIGCNRKVCFFAHRVEELRPVYTSTGSALPSPAAATSSPPMSPKNMNMWQSKVKLSPQNLQLPGSRLKSALSARDLGLEMDSPLAFSQPLDLKPTNLDDMFGSVDSPMMSQLQGIMSLRPSTPTHLRSSYPSKNNSPHFGFDSSSAMAAAVMNSRSAAMAKRSHSFIDRGAMAQNSHFSPAKPSSNLSGWASPEGKLELGHNHRDELNKLRKSASFGIRSHSNNNANAAAAASFDEPDVSWVNSLVKDVSPAEIGPFGANRARGAREMLFSPWVEQIRA